MAGGLQYQITGDASRFVSSLQDAAESAERFESSLAGLSERQIGAQLAQESEKVSSGLEELERSGQSANASLRTLNAGAERAGTSVSDLAGRQELLQSALQQSEAQVRQTGNAVDKFSGKATTMRSSVSASANNLGFEFVQAAQDARFGAAGVANQIPLMTEQFNQLVAKTGSASSALTALGSTFFGTTGIIAAVTLGLQFLPELTGALGDAGDAAEGANEQFDGLFQATQNSTSSLENLSESLGNIDPRASAASGALRLVRDDITRAVPEVRALVAAIESRGGLIDALSSVAMQEIPGLQVLGTEARRGQIIQTTSNLRSLLQESGEAAQFARVQLASMGADVQMIAEGPLPAAQQEVAALGDELETVFERPQEAIRENPEAAANQLQTQLENLQDRLDQEVGADFITRQGAVQEQVQFLEDSLGRLSGAGVDLRNESFSPLLQTLEQLRQRLEALKEEAEESIEVDESWRESLEGRLQQLREMNEIFQDTMLQEQRASQAALQNLPSAGQGPEAVTPGGGSFDQLSSQLGQAMEARSLGFTDLGQSIGRQMLQGARRALVQGDITREEFNALQSGAEDAGFTIGEEVNQELARGIQLASQLGTTMVQAAQQGGAEWNQVLGSLLATIGSVVGVSNPAAGAAIAGGGQILGSFQSGGLVNTPFQLVGEEGPELAALPQGTRVFDHKTSAQMMRPRPVNVRLQTEIISLEPGRLGVAVREAQQQDSLHSSG